MQGGDLKFPNRISMMVFFSFKMTPVPSRKSKKGVKKTLDKLLLGVVIGGAVGSILGVTLAPKSGKETRKMISQKSSQTWQKISRVIEEKGGESEKKSFWHTLNRWFVRKK